MKIKEAITTLLYQESIDAQLTALTDIQMSFTSGVIFDTCEELRESLSMGESIRALQSHTSETVQDPVECRVVLPGEWQNKPTEGAE
jgi:hypothetical protein